MMDMKLEAIILPVADVDRAKAFYVGLGWRLDADFAADDGVRIVQVTPPGSACSVQFGTGLIAPTAAALQGLYLVVTDLVEARAALIERGVRVSEPFHYAKVRGSRIQGLDPERRSYRSWASFDDPDGNGWLLQEITARLPGR